MKLALVALLSISVAAAALFSDAPSTTEAQTPPADNVIPGRYIVVLRDNFIQDRLGERLEDVIENLRGRLGVQREREYRTAFRGFVATNVSNTTLLQLRADPRVLLVEPDRIATTSVQTIPTGIRRAQVTQNATAAIDGAGSNINADVAVIDTGVDTDHPDLNVAGGWGSFCNSACNTCSSVTNTYEDGNGHGTHVSGTIGAKDDANGVVGVAPGARIWGYKVLNNSGSGCFSDIISAVDQVTACKRIANSVPSSTPCSANSNGIDFAVANMSLGGGGSSSALCTAIQNAVNAGVTVAVAAGNDNANSTNYTPANCTGPITVSALADYNGLFGGGASTTCSNYGPDDRLASFSNFGTPVDIAAPGVCILSTWPGGGTNTISGTSMATPHVAGAVALYKAANPSWTPAQVRSAMLAQAFPQNSACGFSGDKDTSFEPLLNLGAACANTAPTVTSTSPANSATNVAAGANVTATFSEAMTSGTINTTTFTLRDSNNNPVTGAVSLSSNTATFNPNTDLAYSTTYTATITTGAQDSQGLGLANNYVWSFSTGAQPVNVPPQVSSTSPASNATNVAVTANITATFNETMNAATLTAGGTFTLQQGSTSIPGSVTYNSSTRVLTFDPTSSLANSTVYTATVSTAAQDSQGLAMTSAVTWSFTTAAASTACVAPTTTSRTDSSATGGGTVSFAWNPVPGATQYRIERQSGFFGLWSLVTTTTATTYSGSDSSNDPSWRIRVQQGTCTGIPGPWLTFDP